MCGKVTPIILHGVVSPENATFCSVLLAGCALFGAAQLRVLSMSGDNSTPRRFHVWGWLAAPEVVGSGGVGDTLPRPAAMLLRQD